MCIYLSFYLSIYLSICNKCVLIIIIIIIHQSTMKSRGIQWDATLPCSAPPFATQAISWSYCSAASEATCSKKVTQLGISMSYTW